DGLVPEDLEEAPFSNTGPDVKAVGQHLQICPISQAKSECEDLGGTSFSSPQVAALASYLWLLSPDLRLRSPADTITAIRANARLNTHTTDILDAYATVLSLDPATLPAPATARIRKAILDVNNDSVFDQADIQIFLSHYFAGGVPLEPATRDYSRFDLNGDGFTGGERTESFDLDRVDSTQFGETLYTVVQQHIEGVDIDFDELQLTDQEILCYYAYSPLYQGDPAVRSALLRDICLPVIVTVVPDSVGLSPGQTRQFIASVGGLPNLDQRVTWSITQGAGSVTADGLFTPDCSLTDGHSQTVIVRATSVAFPEKFAEARVSVQMPLVMFSTSVNAGTLRRGTVGPFFCGSGFDQLDDGPDTSKFPDGDNFASGELQCFCQSTSPGSAIKVPHNVIAGSVSSAGATQVGRFTAPIQTQVSVAFNPGWGTGNFRITASMSGANGSSVNNVMAVFDPTHNQNSVFAPFQIPAGTVMDMTLDAQCTGTASGIGTAVTVTLAPVIPPGVFTLAPAEASVPVTQPLTYAFTWTVPEPENWHDLRELQFRIRDGDQILLWTRFTESDQSFSLYNPASGRFGSTAAAGDRMQLQTSLALLDLERTSVKASGPTSPSVTLNLAVAFKPSAAGRACIVEVAAVDDEGHVDDFKEAGRLTLQPAR
ncbi:MAG TPA: hypothetical protein VN794_19915, partial [Methylomirabilota bacterium]|nr:hypothetical protein [Methylomirabilota bacterium]